ncbi:uncharacterized protein LOC117818427 isoform X2 [Notolabrus celidotus]|nr:uncharacterized protein LOC117818427 isoform X2 [Notolabrus celidotus]
MLNGGKATCFAYGQTGSGKTHTMLGSSPRSPGLYALAVRDIFTHLSSTRMNTPLLVYVSFFEIYCGQLYDLLDHRKRLYAREDGQRMVHIAGLRDVRVDSVSSLLEVIAQGTEERTQGVSGVNPHSSRSHALLQLRLRDPNQQVAGRIWFVDLAGSERASDTKEPDRQSRMEGAEINQSLLALKECIRSLDQEQLHTPFRQSKLTQVLKDSFVGDSMTCMIANISPGHFATEHTLNTLRYADRVKELRGQGGLKGGRRGKTIPSPKCSISKSSSTSRDSIRGKSPPKKPKFRRQREAFVPTMCSTRLATGGPILCSTPKNSRQDEKTSTRDRMDISLEQITPIRGFMRTGVDRKIAGEKEGRRRDRYVGTDIVSHSVREQNVRESGFFHRERENQHRALKKEREGERRLIEEKRKIQRSRDSSTGAESVKGRDLQNDDRRDKEKEMHLRQYHQQLQQFTPSSASSSISPSTCLSSFFSHPASLSSSVALSELSPQHSPHLLYSELTYQGLGEVLDKYRARVNVRADVNRGHVSLIPSGEACLQTETSVNTKNTDEVGHGNSGGRDVKSSRAEWRPAGNEGMRGRGWAWVAMTEAQQAGSMTGVRPAATVAQVSYNCDSDHRREVGGEGQESSYVPAEGVWSNEEHASNDSFFTHPVVDSSNHRAPAERPLSPGCEHTNNSLTPNELCELPFRSNQTRCSSNSLHLPSQSPTGEPSSSCSVKDPLFAADAKKRGLSSTALPQEDSCSYIMDPLSISLLQVDQQAATTSFLQGGLKTSSPCQLDNEIREGSGKEMEKENVACLDMTMRIGEEDGLSILEMPQAKTHYPPISNPITSTNIEKRQYICCTKELIGLGIMELPIPEAMPDSLQDQEINQKPLTGISINVLANKTSASQLKPSKCALSKQTSVIQPISSSVQPCGGKRSPNSHNVMTNGVTQIPPECSQHMHNKHPLSISITPSESVSGQMKTLPKQGHMVHLIPSDKSNISLRPNDWTRSKFERGTSNQKTRNIINLPTLEDVDHAKWCVIQAHWNQLEEMEALWHKEGTLLCQQPDMAFSEYIHNLEEIMKRKAQCVHSMIAQLQPYLKTIGSHQAHDHNQGVHDHDPTT